MRVGQDSTEPVDPQSGLTPTETIWLDQTREHLHELNQLLYERRAEPRYELHRVYP